MCTCLCRKAVWNLFENSRFTFFWAKYSGQICLFLKIVLHCNGFFFSLRLLCWWNIKSLSTAVKKNILHLVICEENSCSEPCIPRIVRLGKVRLASRWVSSSWWLFGKVIHIVRKDYARTSFSNAIVQITSEVEQGFARVRCQCVTRMLQSVQTGLMKKTTYHTSGKVTSLMTSQWRHGWVMMSHGSFRDDSITAKAYNDVTKSTGATILQTSSWPPAHVYVTRRTPLAFYSFYPVQPNHLRCRETWNESITAKRS